MVRRHTRKMDVSLIGMGLRHKSDDEPDDIAILMGYNAGFPEMLEEKPRQHRGHRSSSPPSVDDGDDLVIVRCHDVPKFDVAHYEQVSSVD
jgi:hypothetical protein